MNTVGERIQLVRQKLGFDHNDLARRAGVTAATIESIENDPDYCPNEKEILKFALALSADPNWLSTGEGRWDELSEHFSRVLDLNNTMRSMSNSQLDTLLISARNIMLKPDQES